MTENISNTTCNVCNKDFKSKSHLKRHQSCKYKCKLNDVSISLNNESKIINLDKDDNIINNDTNKTNNISKDNISKDNINNNNNNNNNTDIDGKESLLKLITDVIKNSKNRNEAWELLKSFCNNSNPDTRIVDNNNTDTLILGSTSNESDKYTCEDCKQKFVYRQGLYKHKKLNRCKFKSNIILQNISKDNIQNSVIINNTVNNNSNDTINITLAPNFFINVNALGLESLEHISISDFKKIFRQMDNIMDNLCYHIFKRHIPNISFYKNNLNQKIVSYLSRNLEIERIDEKDFIIELRKYLEDICIQLFYNFKHQLSKDELITYMRNLVEYQNSISTDTSNQTSKKTKDAITRIMDFAFRNKDIKEAIESIIKKLNTNIEMKKNIVLKNKEINKQRMNVIDEFYYKGNELEDTKNNEKLLYKLRKQAEKKNLIEDKKISKRLLTNSLPNIDFTTDKFL